MSKTLRVIDPFFTVDMGDLFTLSEDGKFYVCERNERFYNADDSNELNSSYSSAFTISVDYANVLLDQGYLEEVDKKTNFVNVFDEIDSLIDKYQAELNNIDEDTKNLPQCVKVEKTTVLTNILSVLNHLKTLRK